MGKHTGNGGECSSCSQEAYSIFVIPAPFSQPYMASNKCSITSLLRKKKYILYTFIYICKTKDDNLKVFSLFSNLFDSCFEYSILK